jgi:putative MATE family efflux protein
MQGTKNLTEGVISRQLFNLAMPIMGTSFIQMAYSITDMAWVGRLGSEAVAAIGAVGILTWMTNSISYLNKVGSEVSVGQSIGAQNVEDARGFASHNLTIALILSLCWGFLLFVLAHPIIGFYKLEEPIALNAVEYLRIVASAFPFIFLSAAFTGIHNAAGLSKIPFYISGTGLLLNMVLDPLFILGFHLGTAGAAWATWISQAVVCGLFVYQLKCRNKLFGGFPFFVRLKERYTKRIFQLGLPVALLNTFFAIINLFMARTASTYGGHIGLMTLTAGGQMEAIAWNTSQGFSTALSAFTFQRRDLGGYSLVCRVLKAGIEIAAFLQIEQFSHLLARLILECRALIDREDTGFSFLGLPTGLYAQGFRFEFVIHIGCFFN